jgi:hypothetical protein
MRELRGLILHKYPIFEEELPPDNTAFVVGDVNHGIDFPDESVDCSFEVDILKVGLSVGGITTDQRPLYFKEVLRVLNSGSGRIQVTEPRSGPCSQPPEVFHETQHSVKSLSVILRT